MHVRMHTCTHACTHAHSQSHWYFRAMSKKKEKKKKTKTGLKFCCAPSLSIRLIVFRFSTIFEDLYILFVDGVKRGVITLVGEIPCYETYSCYKSLFSYLCPSLTGLMVSMDVKHHERKERMHMCVCVRAFHISYVWTLVDVYTTC